MEDQKYRVTISLITTREVKETTDVYINDKTGEVLTWNGWYDLGKEDKKEQSKFKKVMQETGDVEIKESEQKLFEQELNDLDVGELAVYINRAR